MEEPEYHPCSEKRVRTHRRWDPGWGLGSKRVSIHIMHIIHSMHWPSCPARQTMWFFGSSFLGFQGAL